MLVSFHPSSVKVEVNMRVSELTPGMAIKAKKGYSLVMYTGGYYTPVPAAGCAPDDNVWLRNNYRRAVSDVAVYAGRRKDLGHSKGTQRFVLLDGQLVPFWPQDWKHCEKA